MLEFSPFAADIALISIGVTLFSATVRHFTIDKAAAKEQKTKVKELQKKVSDARKSGDQDRMQKHSAELMEVNMNFMKTSMKPMIFTFIPIILIFGFLRSTYGGIGALNNVTVMDYLPDTMSATSFMVLPDGTYDETSNRVIHKVGRLDAGAKGFFNVTLVVDGDIDYSPTTLETEYSVMNGSSYRFTQKANEDAEGNELLLKKSQYLVSGRKVSYIVDYENQADWTVANIFGYRLGWLGFYIVVSIIPSIIINKLFGNS